MIEVADGRTEEWFVSPGDVGVAAAALEDVAGGERAENAATVRRVLDGQAGPTLEVVALNAGAAIMVGGGADDLGAGVERAREAIESGGTVGARPADRAERRARRGGCDMRCFSTERSVSGGEAAAGGSP